MQEKIIYADTIYDMCKQQDCLTPECNSAQPLNNYLISPARNATGFDVVFTNSTSNISITTNPNDVYYIPSNYLTVDIVKDSFETVMDVKFFKENLTRKGYYDLTIEYRFNYSLEFFDAQTNPIPVFIQGTKLYQIQAYSTYTKHVTLCGGDVKNRVTTLNSISGQCCSKFPEYNIQSTSDVLNTELTKVSDLICNPYVDQTQNTLDPSGVYVVSVTIGLFTIISLFRQTRVNILTGKDVKIPTCDNPFCNPCGDFNDTPFPYDLFNTPSCGEYNNHKCTE